MYRRASQFTPTAAPRQVHERDAQVGARVVDVIGVTQEAEERLLCEVFGERVALGGDVVAVLGGDLGDDLGDQVCQVGHVHRQSTAVDGHEPV